MLNNKDLWEKSQHIAAILETYAKSLKNANKAKNQEFANLLAALNKKQFIEGLACITKGNKDVGELEEIAKLIHELPIDNVPYFLTLIRFQYAVLQN